MKWELNNRKVLQFLKVVSWVLFIGLAIDTGSYIFNGFYVFFINDYATKYFGLFDLYHADSGNYIVMLLFMTIVSLFKTLIFYTVIKMFNNEFIELKKPFTEHFVKLMSCIFYQILGIGIFSYWGSKYANWLSSKNIVMPTVDQLNLGGADVWIFMAIVLLVINQILKRGVELQNENNLTI